MEGRRKHMKKMNMVIEVFALSERDRFAKAFVTFKSFDAVKLKIYLYLVDPSSGMSGREDTP